MNPKLRSTWPGACDPRRWTLSLACCLLAALASASVGADERILAYESAVTIRTDGGLDVTERIRVRAEGTNIRRGIYRDFPTRYKDRLGNRVNVGFELLGVLRDGRPEPHFTERRANGVRINTGDDSLLPTPLETTYTLRYRTTRQLGFFEGHDELYWNVTGLGWDFPIGSAQATITLPTPVPADRLTLAAYTGPHGSRASDASARVPAPGVATFRTTRALGPREGLTVVVGFPKGLVAAPTQAQRTRWFLHDNRGVLVAVAGLLLLAAFYAFRWSQVGRDPRGGPIFPRYDPPPGFSPGELRQLRRMGGSRLGFTADVVDMAVRGFLDIHAGTKAGGWRLVKRPGASADTLAPSERALAARLFRDSGEITLEDSEAARVGGTLSAHAAATRDRMKPRYYVTNAGSLFAGIAFSTVVGILAAVLSGGNGLLVIAIVVVLKLALHILFARLLRAPTREGRKLLDEIEGLALYLGVAERDALGALRGPSRRAPAPRGATADDAASEGVPPTLDAKRYEALLPYAMALDVEQAWTTQFIRAVGAAMAQQATPGWYHDTAGRPMQLASLGPSIGSALSQQISASATPPGSSSGGGGGGGGFSGGGGGGGGGGGR